jgi:uncharacterized protein with von Willebrand factor type A (vWA) domain
MSYLFHNLLHFSRLLHAAGLDVHAGRMPEVAAALGYIDIGSRSDFYFTLRTLLVHRRQDLAPFDEAFRVFWRRHAEDRTTMDLRALGERRRFANPQVDFPSVEPGASDGDSSVRTLSEVVQRVAPMSYSSNAISRTKDFAEFTERELSEAKALLNALKWQPGTRRTHRWISGAGEATDFRLIIRHNVRFGGELLEIPERERKEKRRPLVLLCDISGSMERYSRMLLHFVHTIAGEMDRVEAFLFATRLTCITRELAERSADEALFKICRHVPDWSGGTRIGEALRTFNVIWARRTLARGAVVLLISDGWDRGDPELLRAEISRLRRTCYRLIWLNPLLGSSGYQPLTRGMQAALPSIDDFLPAHNLASLESLAQHLNALPPRRSGPAGSSAAWAARKTVHAQLGDARPTRRA